MEVNKKSSFSDGTIRMIQGAILALALTVFLGNLMMWIIMPTFTYYQKWVPVLVATTNSTFFDIQGIYTNSSFISIPFLFLVKTDSKFEYQKVESGIILLKTREFPMKTVGNQEEYPPKETFIRNLRVLILVIVYTYPITSLIYRFQFYYLHLLNGSFNTYIRSKLKFHIESG